MPSASARQVFQDQIPSFMSVFDLDAETMVDRDTVTLVDPNMVNMETSAKTFLGSTQQGPLRPDGIPSQPKHNHNGSASSQISESADSSPTTTLSTTDSSPLSDPSPSSSPDSPLNLIPLNNYPSTSFGALSTNSANPFALSPPNVPPPPIPSTTSTASSRPMTSPGPRRPRNMKGLSIQPPCLGSAMGGKTMVSEPSSPNFIKPKIPTMKRKPSQLSLKTNTTDLMSRPALEVPPSPGMGPIMQRRALKHSASTPHMLAGPATSSFGPSGGMTFPKVLERNESGLSEVLRPMKSSMKATFDDSIKEEHSPIRSQVANRGDHETFEENVNNEDQKSPGYPDGPIAIYGDNVFLYLEPSADEAAKFDVVINVAREVHNPFDQPPEIKAPRLLRHFPLSPLVESPVPESAISTASFATAFEYQPDDQSLDTPTTPKANPLSAPEYIHMPWDHNTDIAPDLMGLCETIDTRIKQGKKVLIHCQQGASRSASLIIAYGMYQNPALSVNDAYYAAQAKSRWISPNMKLMYSLQDFQKEVSRIRSSSISGSRGRTGGKSPTRHRLTMSADAIDVASKEPLTAPLPADDSPQSRGVMPVSAASRPRGHSSPTKRDISPGPATAPFNFQWGSHIQPPPASVDDPMQIDSHPQQEAVIERLTPQKPWQMELETPIDAPANPFRFGELPKKSRRGEPNQRLASTIGSRQIPPPTPGFGSFGNSGFQSLSFPPVPNAVPAPPSRAPPPPPPRPKSAAPGHVKQSVIVRATFPHDDALMSPRVETMTKNPLQSFGDFQRTTVEEPATPNDNLFSPRITEFPRDALSPFGRPPRVADPRSPPTVGEAPITRSIDDLL